MNWERGIKRLYLAVWPIWATYCFHQWLDDHWDDAPMALVWALVVPGVVYFALSWAIAGFKPDKNQGKGSP